MKVKRFAVTVTTVYGSVTSTVESTGSRATVARKLGDLLGGTSRVIDRAQYARALGGHLSTDARWFNVDVVSA